MIRVQYLEGKTSRTKFINKNIDRRYKKKKNLQIFCFAEKSCPLCLPFVFLGLGTITPNLKRYPYAKGKVLLFGKVPKSEKGQEANPKLN